MNDSVNWKIIEISVFLFYFFKTWIGFFRVKVPVIRNRSVDTDLVAPDEMDAEPGDRIRQVFRLDVFGDVALPVKLVPFQTWNIIFGLAT